MRHLAGVCVTTLPVLWSLGQVTSAQRSFCVWTAIPVYPAMAWALCLLALLSHFSGAISQPTLTQPASQSVSLGQTAKLSCTATRTVTYISWFQQKPGQALRFVHCNDCGRGEGIPDRFTASLSGTTGYLNIADVQSGDEADYYCGAWFSIPGANIFGDGTLLNITGQPSVKPKVSVYPPSDEQISTKQKATLVCLISDFYPGQVEVQWLGDGKLISAGVETSKPIKRGQNYVASSYLTQTPQDWQSRNTYTCKVTHAGQVIEKTATRT